ncbi:AAA family ATPase [Alcaligenaceae bacterium]|nr:AAA family ATPase [Alcaligenaceae bacterium]
MIVQDQSAVITFLSDPANFGEPATAITCIHTHISIVFFVAQRVFKLKRAVRLPYLDFSTLEQRLAACRQELLLNRRTAPMLYVGVHCITRADDGHLSFDGQGELIDVVVEMVRFDENTLFDRMATCGQLTPALLTELARIIARFHTSTVPVYQQAGAAKIASILDINEQALATTSIFTADEIAVLTKKLRVSFNQHEALLNARGRAGKVRRCHGDLHLRNICLVDDVPTLFDCIEFDEDVATIDVLYDAAFLMMDLWHRGFASSANLVFNRYFDERDETDGLPLLSFFMAIRATVRAHVTATQAEQTTGEQYEKLACDARAYCSLALDLLASTSPARLVAIGGLSGTGKSTIAVAVASRIGPAPGARVLASDRIRKHLYGVQAEVRLHAEAYYPKVSEQVYGLLAQNAQAVLVNGHAVLIDAVFERATDRQHISHISFSEGVPFTGIWLHAQPDTLFTRVGARRNDVSDATADVVRMQLANQDSPVDWVWIDTGGGIATTVARVVEVLG